jgi:hypothetical protein
VHHRGHLWPQTQQLYFFLWYMILGTQLWFIGHKFTIGVLLLHRELAETQLTNHFCCSDLLDFGHNIIKNYPIQCITWSSHKEVWLWKVCCMPMDFEGCAPCCTRIIFLSWIKEGRLYEEHNFARYKWTQNSTQLWTTKFYLDKGAASEQWNGKNCKEMCTAYA